MSCESDSNKSAPPPPAFASLALREARLEAPIAARFSSSCFSLTLVLSANALRVIESISAGPILTRPMASASVSATSSCS